MGIHDHLELNEVNIPNNNIEHLSHEEVPLH